jgi:diadenosine tetraphosphate (Ap4A) HIT family hydrolase
VESIADLTDAAAEQFGTILRQAVAAINQVVHPERVYVICLAELEPRVHFHLFPRTRTVTETYRHATGYHDAAINGLVFMQWARSNLPLENDRDKQRIAKAITELQVAMGGGR